MTECHDCGRVVADWRGQDYEIARDRWQYLCPSCAGGRDDIFADEGRDRGDYTCPRCGEASDIEGVGHHDRDGQRRKVIACNDCGLVYTRPCHRGTWRGELYRLATREAHAPDSMLMVETHTQGVGEDYADIICSTACRDHLVRTLRSEGYEYDVDRVTGLRIRIRVYRDA